MKFLCFITLNPFFIALLAIFTAILSYFWWFIPLTNCHKWSYFDPLRQYDVIYVQPPIDIPLVIFRFLPFWGGSVAVAASISNRWHVTDNTQQMTFDMWHVTPDIWIIYFQQQNGKINISWIIWSQWLYLFSGRS